MNCISGDQFFTMSVVHVGRRRIDLVNFVPRPQPFLRQQARRKVGREAMANVSVFIH